jgi:hypothetical protein
MQQQQLGKVGRQCSVVASGDVGLPLLLTLRQLPSPSQQRCVSSVICYVVTLVLMSFGSVKGTENNMDACWFLMAASADPASASKPKSAMVDAALFKQLL